jgi:hypothetical protein
MRSGKEGMRGEEMKRFLYGRKTARFIREVSRVLGF